jgi:hypothetical protein
MIHFLTTQSIWVSGGIIVGIGTVLSVLGPVLLRRYARAKRSVDTDIAGFKFGTIGALYAVLLAFAIIVVWEKFSDAELNAVQEAGAAENVYRLSQGLSDNARVAVVNGVANYLKAAINVEWPAMDQGYPFEFTRGSGTTYSASARHLSSSKVEFTSAVWRISEVVTSRPNVRAAA